MTKQLEIAFIGGGNMARALASGMVKQRGSGQHLLVMDVNQSALDHWASFGATGILQAGAQLSQCAIWILAVKPQQMHEVAQAIKPYLHKDVLIISVAAGLTTTILSQWFEHVNIIRTMPNTPALIAKGVTGLYAMPGVSQEQRERAVEILMAVGQVVPVEHESLLDAITALSGSGPAYVFLFIEALIAGGEKLGLSYTQAKALALGTLEGAASLAAGSEQEPDVLRQNVSSKGGTTVAALDVFAQHDFNTMVAQAMQAASDRAEEMAKEFGQV